MFHVFPKSRRECVTTLLRPFWFCLAVAFPAYLLLDDIYGSSLKYFVAEALVEFCILSFFILLVSTPILFFIGKGRDAYLLQCAWTNIAFVALSLVLGCYFAGHMFYH